MWLKVLVMLSHLTITFCLYKVNPFLAMAYTTYLFINVFSAVYQASVKKEEMKKAKKKTSAKKPNQNKIREKALINLLNRGEEITMAAVMNEIRRLSS